MKNIQFIFILALLICFNHAKSQVVINEIGISPTSGDGSMVGLSTSAGGQGQGEWVELYNTGCTTIDLSGYIIGTYNSYDGNGMALLIPNGKTIGPKGFAVIRGTLKAAPGAGITDISIQSTDVNNYCVAYPNPGSGETRFWFQNSGQWMGLYDKTGKVLDMVSWGTPNTDPMSNASDLTGNPCLPANSTLPSGTTLTSFSSYGSGYTFAINSTMGKTFVRLPDGGAWSATQVSENTSYGSHNQPLPTATLTYSTPFCTSQGVQSPTLTGTGTYTGGTYSSTAGLTINSANGQITPSSSTIGTYKVKYSLSTLACPGYDSTTVTIADPTATATKTDPTCTGVTPNTDGKITITTSGGTAPFTYSSDNGATYGNANPIINLASNTYTVKVKDSKGCIATVSPSLTLSVVCNCTSPIINTQPVSTKVCLNANATFTVAANATASGYQWQVNSGAGWTNIVGQTTATLTLTSVTAAMNSYQYQCIVKEATGNCPITSSAATLTVDNISATATSTNPTCNGAVANTDGTITITATNGTAPYTYSSDNGATFPFTNQITGLASNTYTVKAKDANGCIATVSPAITLTVTCPATPCTAPIITTQPTATTTCVNTNATFSVVANATATAYQWQVNNGGGFTNINGQTNATLTLSSVTSSMNTYQYRCIISEATGNCPLTSNSAQLTVDPLPTATAGGSVTTCSTTPASITGATASNGLISWNHNGSGSITGGTTTTPIYTPAIGDTGKTVILTMTVTSNNSCNPASSQANFSIKVDAQPTALAGSSTTICSNTTATVSGASATNATILWTHNGTGSISNQTTNSPIYTATANDEGKVVTLTMHATSSNSCPNPTNPIYTINIDPLPKATAGGSQTICSNTTATVSGATGINGTISWSHNGQGTLTNGTTLTPTYSPVTADENKTVILTLTVTSTNSCSSSPAATATYNVLVTPIITATATAGGVDTICVNTSANVTGATATNGTILWTHNGHGILTNATTLTPTYSSVYSDTLAPVILTIKVTPTGSCSNLVPTATYTINVKSNPKVIPTATNPCEGKNLVLNANTIVGGTYSWSGPNNFTSTSQSPNIPNVTLSSAGTYTLQITDANKCTNTNTVQVSINPNPIISTDTLVCVGSTVQFSANTTPALTNPWVSQTPSLISIDSLKGIATGILGGIATINYTDIKTCTASKTIQVENLPVINFTVDSTSVCLGNKVVFTDISANKNVNLLWNFGDGTTSNELAPSHTYLKVDSFSVSLTSTSPSGCKNTFTKNKYITPIPIPNVNFTFSPDSIQIYSPEVQFTNISNAKYYTWIFNDYSPISHEVNPSHTFPSTPGESYIVTLKGSNSIDGICPSIASHEIVAVDPPVFYVPNTFTPNGDEINNTFQPIFTSGFDPQHYVLWIYDRWGELIFESHNSTYGWDGTYGNKIAENNTYVWKIQFKSKQTEREYYLTGNVNLVN